MVVIIRRDLNCTKVILIRDFGLSFFKIVNKVSDYVVEGVDQVFS